MDNEIRDNWVSTWRLPPPHNQTVMVRFGATVFDAAYSKWQNKWFMVLPGGQEEEIAEPPLWWCRDPQKAKLAATEPDAIMPNVEKLSFRRSRRPKQLNLAF